jgi:hypothetical protein
MFVKILRSSSLLLIGFSLFILVTVFCEAVYTDDYEPNDTFEDAAFVSLGTIKATVNPEDDEDYYKLNIGGSDSLMLAYQLAVPSVIQPEINFYTADKNPLDRKRADAAGESLKDSLTVSPGEVVIRVRSFNYESSDSSYTLTLSTSLPAVAASTD